MNTIYLKLMLSVSILTASIAHAEVALDLSTWSKTGGAGHTLRTDSSSDIWLNGHGPWQVGLSFNNGNANIYTYYDQSIRIRRWRIEGTVAWNRPQGRYKNDPSTRFTTTRKIYRRVGGKWKIFVNKTNSWTVAKYGASKKFYHDYPRNSKGDPIPGKYHFKLITKDDKTNKTVIQRTTWKVKPVKSRSGATHVGSSRTNGNRTYKYPIFYYGAGNNRLYNG